MTAARRLAAILAVDVAGYSRLMGEDEAGTAESVREHREAARPMVAGLSGRFVKTMRDGLFARILVRRRGDRMRDRAPEADGPATTPETMLALRSAPSRVRDSTESTV